MVRTEYRRTRDSSGGVCEHSVSTCRTAENKDRSREWVLVSQQGERRRERERLAGCLTEARWRRRRRQPGVVVMVVDVEVPEYPRLNSDSGVDVSRERGVMTSSLNLRQPAASVTPILLTSPRER